MSTDGLCRTCGCPRGEPFRRANKDGEIVEGCVDEDHTGWLVKGSASEAWHMRPSVVKLRRDIADRLAKILLGAPKGERR